MEIVSVNKKPTIMVLSDVIKLLCIGIRVERVKVHGKHIIMMGILIMIFYLTVGFYAGTHAIKQHYKNGSDTIA